MRARMPAPACRPCPRRVPCAGSPQPPRGRIRNVTQTGGRRPSVGQRPLPKPPVVIRLKCTATWRKRKRMKISRLRSFGGGGGTASLKDRIVHSTAPRRHDNDNDDDLLLSGQGNGQNGQNGATNKRNSDGQEGMRSNGNDGKGRNSSSKNSETNIQGAEKRTGSSAIHG